MLILEIGKEYIKIIDEKKEKKSIINFNNEIISNGNILNIPDVFSELKSKIDIDETKQISFILNSTKILTKEVSYPITRKSKLKVLVGLSIKKNFPELINEDYTFSYEILEKTRVLLYAAPKELISSCISLAEMLNLKVKRIDYSDNILVNHIKKLPGLETKMIINIKEGITVISILKEGILKLQSSISNVNNASLISAISRIIKYYSDKNNKEHIHEVCIYDRYGDSEKLSLEIKSKLLLNVSVIKDEELSIKINEHGTLNFAEDSQIKDKGISKYFSIYRLIVILCIGIFLYSVTPPLMEYFYTISEKNEVLGDIDAIDDIVEIINQEKQAKEKLLIAKKYEEIIDTLPNDSTDISVNVDEKNITITGKYITEIDETDIREKFKDITISVEGSDNTFEIISSLGVEDN